jgi:hypothetical protein
VARVARTADSARQSFGFSNAATHNWHTPSTYGFLAAGVALLAAFALWQARAASPLLPPRVVLDRNRGAAYLAVLIVGAGMFGIFLFRTYYMQQTLGYSPVVSGVAFLPMIAMVVVSANLSNVVLLPRLGPKPLVTAGMLLAAGSLVWLTRIGVHSGYASAVLGPLMVAGLGFGFTIAPSMNTGTFGVAPQDAGVASATLNTGQQIGGSIGTSLLNTIFASAVAHYLTSHLSPATLVHGHPAPSLIGMSLIHGYTTGFWVAAAIFSVGAVICGTLFRSGPLRASRQEPVDAPLQRGVGRPKRATMSTLPSSCNRRRQSEPSRPYPLGGLTGRLATRTTLRLTVNRLARARNVGCRDGNYARRRARIAFRSRVQPRHQASACVLAAGATPVRHDPARARSEKDAGRNPHSALSSRNRTKLPPNDLRGHQAEAEPRETADPPEPPTRAYPTRACPASVGSRVARIRTVVVLPAPWAFWPERPGTTQPGSSQGHQRIASS